VGLKHGGKKMNENTSLDRLEAKAQESAGRRYRENIT
jgi:hypothetical protein